MRLTDVRILQVLAIDGRALYNGMLLGARRMVNSYISDKTVPSNKVCALAMDVK